MTPLFELTSQTIPTYDTCIVDGSYLIHRILYASGSKGEPPFSEMMTSMGEPTGAIYGCLKTLRSIINLTELNARDLVIVWDGRPGGLSPRRKAIFPGYKLHEAVDIEDIADPKKAAQAASDKKASARHRELLEEQRPKLCRILQMLGVPSVNLPYREGDDIIACATRVLPGKLLIMSDDRDYYQLVSDKVHVYRAGVKDPYLLHPDNFEQKLGLKSTSRYLVVAAITGDGSDCIPGISDVGDVTAQRVANAMIFTDWVCREPIEKAATKMMTEDTRNRKRYAKLLDNLNIVTRNLDLMDLRLETWNAQEVSAFWEVFRQPREVQERDVIAAFHSLEFKSYLENFSDWVLPFKKLRRLEEVSA